MADLAASAIAVSFVKSGKTVFGNKRVSIGYLTWTQGGSDTVPAAGLSLTPDQFGLRGVDIVLFAPDGTTNAADARTYIYDYVAQKILCGTGAAVPASGEMTRFIAIGYGTK